MTSSAPLKKFSDRLNDLVTIINPLAYMVFKDNPIIIMIMPIIIFIIRQIEELFSTSARIYKDMFPNMASIVISDLQLQGYNSKCYTFVSWYIAKECKMDKIEATTYYGRVINYELDDDVIGSLKYKNDTIFIHSHNKKILSANDRKIILYSKNNNIDTLKDFINMCTDEYFVEAVKKKVEENTYQLMNFSGGIWSATKINVLKTKENTFLSEEQENIFNIAQKFIKSENIYKDHGIPYKKGILLHGLPGTGKSSIGYALAHAFNLNIYKLDYKCLGSEQQFMTAVNNIPVRSLVIIEDIDTYKFAQDRNDKKTKTDIAAESLSNISTTLSTIITTDENKYDIPNTTNTIQMESVLHVLDGYTCLHGCIVIFTTNHMNHVDPALLRPGRIDHHYEFTYATRKQIENILKYFNQAHLIDKYIVDNKPIQVTTADIIQNTLTQFITNKMENLEELENLEESSE